MSRKKSILDLPEPPPIEFPKRYVVLVMERDADLPVFVRFRPDGEIETLSLLEDPPEAFFYEEGEPILSAGKKLEELCPGVLIQVFCRPLNRPTLDLMHQIAFVNLEAEGLSPEQRKVQTHH